MSENNSEILLKFATYSIYILKVIYTLSWNCSRIHSPDKTSVTLCSISRVQSKGTTGKNLRRSQNKNVHGR